MMTELARTQLELRTLELIIIEKLDKFNAMSVSQKYNEIMRDTINWHEFSSILDNFHTLGVLVVSGHNSSGMTEYKLV